MAKLTRGANYTGNQLEKIVKDRLTEKGYKYFPKEKFRPGTYLHQPIYTRQLPVCKSIYETNCCPDFILYHPQKHPECLIGIYSIVLFKGHYPN